MAPKSTTRRSTLGPNWNRHRPSSSFPSRCRPSHSHFFKIILPSTMHEMKLRLPVKFVREFGDKLSRVATLTVPNGRIWQVGLEKANNNLWFCDGWREFVEYHSIKYGYFLVFKYEGNSKFDVLVFDMTATEIKYPSNGDKTRQGNPNENEMSTPHEMYAKQEVDIELPVNQKISNMSSKRRDVMSEGRERTIQAARMFKPKNPSFIRVIQAYNLYNSFVYLPTEFANKYIRGINFIKLQASGGKEWVCRCITRNGATSPKSIGKGWTPFCRDNNLKEGDACVFELVKRRGVVLKVSIFRVVEYVGQVN